MMLTGSWLVAPEAAVRIGFITDVHYADKDTSGNRFYRAGGQKLSQAISLWQDWGVDAVYENGDFVDQGGRTKAQALSDMAFIETIYATAGVPRYYGFGNHCLDLITKAEFIAATGMEDGYYHFDIRGIRFIVLDPCFRSDNDNDPFSAGNFTWSTSYVPPNQRSWLQARINEFDGPIVIFCHYQLVGATYAVTNAGAVRSIVEASPKIVAIFGGHAHSNTIIHSGGKPYFGMQAATEGALPSNAYGVLEVRRSGVRVFGYNGQQVY